MFAVGDLIVYSETGVCRVEQVGAPPFDPKAKREYYTLSPLNSRETIYVPVDTQVFMRPILSRAAAEELIIPYQVDGIYVKSFLPVVFFDDKNLKSITIQENIHAISNGSFLGCDNLERIVLRHIEPSEISVGYELLSGVPGTCRIYVPKSALSEFENNYFWGRYAKQTEGYTE